MKKYIAPQIKTHNVELKNMIAVSGENVDNGGSYSGGSVAGQANSRRGTWGDFWGDEEE